MRERWLYLSFIDETLPEGERFVGGMYIPPENDPLIVWPSWLVNDFPKGTQMCVTLIPTSAVPVDHKWHDRVLTREEIAECSGGAVSYGEMREAAGA